MFVTIIIFYYLKKISATKQNNSWALEEKIKVKNNIKNTCIKKTIAFMTENTLTSNKNFVLPHPLSFKMRMDITIYHILPHLLCNIISLELFLEMTRILSKVLIHVFDKYGNVEFLVSLKFEWKKNELCDIYRWMTVCPRSSLNGAKSFLSREDRLKIAQLFLLDSFSRVLPLVTLLAGELASPPPLLLLSDDLSSDERSDDLLSDDLSSDDDR